MMDSDMSMTPIINSKLHNGLVSKSYFLLVFMLMIR